MEGRNIKEAVEITKKTYSGLDVQKILVLAEHGNGTCTI